MEKKMIFTFPNILSLFRILLIPVYVYIYLNATNSADYILAGIILTVSCLTDMLDGIIARKFNLISPLGKILDPIADKLTQGVLIFCISLTVKRVWILFILFFLKEGFMAVMGIVNLHRGKILDGAKLGGKICTAILFICLILMVIFPKMPDNAVDLLIGVCIIFMIYSFISYFMTYFKKTNELVSLHKEEH